MKIIWCADPFAPLSSQDSVLKLLRTLESTASSLEITVLYVASPSIVPLPGGDKASRRWLEQKALPALKKRVAALGKMAASVKIRVLPAPALSVRGEVSVILKYARRQGCEMIVTSTHARSGLSRWVLGSFAETLILSSEIPVLAVGPRARIRPALSPILFPTDFSKASEKAFRSTLEWARVLGAELLLYHAVSAQHSRHIRAQMRKRGEAWQKQARAWDIPCSLIFEKTTDPLVESVLRQLQKHKVGFVALAAEMGPWSALFAGSLPRALVRAAPCPVGVYYVPWK